MRAWQANGMIRRLAGCLMLACLFLVQLSATGSTNELRIAAWNLEHLDDTDGHGCVGRNSVDYASLARRIVTLDADIVAFQEVENVVAAHRVFPGSVWNVEVSRRPAMRRSRPCRARPQSRLGQLATGFAIRRGVLYRRNGDLKALGGSGAVQRWGTDITVIAQGREVRLLSVHLRSGCWGSRQDRQKRSRKACATLRAQIEHLHRWADARQTEGTAYVILGDFNRRLTATGDWAWKILASSSASLRLLTKGTSSRCDPRFPVFIDHLVAGGGAEAMFVEGSFREQPREGRHPDHCAVSAVFRTAW